MNNMIITGIPRSGTTLTCHLLNKLPDTIALHEPMKLVAKDEFCEDYDLLRQRVDQFFVQTRQSLLTHGRAVTKHQNGQIPANSRGAYGGFFKYLPNWLLGRQVLGLTVTRPSLVNKSTVTFNKPLSASFSLYIKHNGGFVTMLSSLTPHYRCYAIVRNPLAVLASWNSLKINLYDGHMHTVERMNGALRHDLSLIHNRINRQLHLLHWFFTELQQQLPPTHIIRYEELIASQGKALQVMAPSASTLSEALNNKNQNSLYNRGTMRFLAGELLQRDGAYWNFYDRQEVESLLTNEGAR